MQKNFELTNADSCWNKAADDEELFVLRGTDPAAPAAIEAWRMERIALGLNDINDDKIASAAGVIEKMMTPELLLQIAEGKIMFTLAHIAGAFSVTNFEVLVNDTDMISIGITLLFDHPEKEQVFYFPVGWHGDDIGIEVGEDGDLVEIENYLGEELFRQLLLAGIDDEMPFGHPSNDGRGDK